MSRSQIGISDFFSPKRKGAERSGNDEGGNCDISTVPKKKKDSKKN